MSRILYAFEVFFAKINIKDIILILIFAAIIYYALLFLKKNNAEKLSAVIIFSILISGLFFIYKNLSGEIFFLFIVLLFVLIFSVFSFELKRDIWDTNNKTPDFNQSNEINDVEKCVNEIIKALQNMSKNDIGAIIILSNNNVPAQILESGVELNSDISSQIIESVFFPKSPLHDGAMIINGQKIQAAGCFLPLSQEVNLPKELGTRHRAGIGITEASNVTALIVSEETGIISIANSGKIKRYADADMLKSTLKDFYWQAYLLSDKKRRD